MPTTVTLGNPSEQWGRTLLGLFAWGDILQVAGQFVEIVPAAFAGGLVYDAAVRRNANGWVIDPPRISSFTLQATFERSTSLPGTDNQLRVSMVPEVTPLLYANSSGLYPTTRGEVLVDVYDLGALAVPTQVSLLFPAAVVQQFRELYWCRSWWNGRIAITLEAVGANGFRASNNPATPVLGVTSQTPFFTGLVGGPTGHHVRAVRDGRFGVPCFNNEVVEDQEHHGVWVRSWDRDPEDDPGSWVPDPNEGVVDDEIPEL